MSSIATSPASSANDSAPAQPGELLQRMIDAAATGSEVVLPAGRYVMRDSLRLRSGVRVKAAGDVILTRAPVVESALACIVGYGHCEFQVADPSLFEVGMGFAMTDKRAGGFGNTLGRIVGRQGNSFLTDVPANRDFRPSDEARVRSIFPLVAGYDVEHVDVQGLILDGEAATTALLDGCRDAGVFLIGCQDICLSRIEVRGYGGDAISFQQCVDVYVLDCHLHHNAGHGMHPGSGTVRYVIKNNSIHDNGNCGIFYCLRTTHSECTDNTIERNGAEGITIGERDTDHLVADNTIRGNGRAGVRFRKPAVESGDRVIVRSNTIIDNGAGETNLQVDIAAGLHDVRLLNNTIAGPGSVLVRVGANCQRTVLQGNTLAEGAPAKDAVEALSEILGTVAEPLRISPSDLPLNGAQHLRRSQLPAWRNRTPL